MVGDFLFVATCSYNGVDGCVANFDNLVETVDNRCKQKDENTSNAYDVEEIVI